MVFISDDEMDKLDKAGVTSAAPAPAPSAPKPGFISDDEMGALEAKGPPSFTDKAMDTAKQFGQSAVENLSGLGAMAGGVVGGALGNVPGAVAGAGVGGYLGEAGKNLIHQYTDPEKAPKTSQEYLTEPLIAGAGAVAGEALGHGLGSAFSRMRGAIPKLLTRGGEASTGVPEQELATYATKTNLINKMIEDSGGNVTVAADTAREGMQADLRGAKNKLNAQITKVLDLAPTQKTISTDPIIMRLEVEKSKLNPHLQSEAVQDIQDTIDKIKLTTQDGMGNLRDLQDIKNYLYNKGKKAYVKDGKLFSTAAESQRAAKGAGAEALKIINPLAPEIKAANKQLSQLHNIEERLNKNLIAPGTPEGALLAAGGAPKSRNATMLAGLDKITGGNFQEEAQNLAAVKRFASPSFSPIDPTGKSTTRLLSGAAVGAGIGGLTGGKEGALVGGAIGGGLTSPAAVKIGINIANNIGSIIQSAGNSKVFGQFAPVIEAAMKRGPEALAVTGTMLAKDPQFRQMLDALSPR